MVPNLEHQKARFSEPLSKNKEFLFTEKEHKIKVFGTW